MPKTIYNANYRKIWSDHHGAIPKDEEGRSYEIHHVDGDKSNNNIDNLQCLSIQEHYDVHFKQEDFGACALIGCRMKKSPHEISALQTAAMKQPKTIAAHRAGLKRYYESADKEYLSERAKKGIQVQLEQGNHVSTNKVAQAKKSKLFSGEGNPFHGKKHSEESKKQQQIEPQDYWLDLLLLKLKPLDLN